ncbi:unnamed protein product [Microthlaspi erraticum]|uniref:Peptidase C1A papain C-terminal domain-containing protein n=1 Tax=Microthlaspi erraticum TaxID=1685480 RepID=A0A6D2JA19_9BRAS|nr:unnamed protein product [Microthlaspi erraticum]
MEEEKKDSDSSDEGGDGAGGRGKDKISAKKSKKKASASASTSTRKLSKDEDTWPKDLPDDFEHYERNWNNYLRAAMLQGFLGFCWAVAIVRCIEALLAITRNVVVELSPQHLVNNTRNKDKTTGEVRKYNEIRRFLTNQGLVIERACPYSGKMNQDCPKSCLKCDEPVVKIRELVYIKGKEVNEKELIKMVDRRPILAVVEAYTSFQDYKSGIYEGSTDHKEGSLGRHVVIVSGFGSTSEGVNYWIIQNSWGTQWGENGYGKIIRESSRNGKPSLFLKAIRLEVLV